MADRVVRQLTADEMRVVRGGGDRVVRQLTPDEMRVIASPPQQVSPQASQPAADDFSLPNYRTEFKPEDLGMLNALGRGGLSGLTFGFSDELLPDTEKQRRYHEALKQEHPWTYFAGEVLGAALPTMATGGIGLVGRAAASGAGWALRAQKLASKVKYADKIGQAMLNVGDRPIIGGILGMTGRGTPSIGTLARVGALSGAAHGLGEKHSDRLQGAREGAIAGGLLGAAGGGAVSLVSKGVGAIGRKVLPRSGAREVGEMLAETSGSDIVSKLRELEKTPTKSVFEIKPETAKYVTPLSRENLAVNDLLSSEFRRLRGQVAENIDDLVTDSTTRIVDVPDSLNKIRENATLVSRESYEKAMANPFDVSDDLYREINNLLESETIRKQFNKAVADLSDIRVSRDIADISGYVVRPLHDSRYENVSYELSKPLLDQLYKNLGELSQQAFLEGNKATSATIGGLQKKLGGVLQRHIDGYAEATTTHRKNLLPADFLQQGYESFMQGSPNDMAFALKTLFQKNDDILTPEMSDMLLGRFREGFSAGLREYLGKFTKSEIPGKLMNLLDKPNFEKKFSIVFGDDSIKGIEKLEKLQKQVGEELRRSKFFKGRDFQGLHVIDLRNEFGVPTSNYQLVASLIETASELLTPQSERMLRQQELIQAMLAQSSRNPYKAARKLRQETQKAFRKRELTDMLVKSSIPASARYATGTIYAEQPEPR